MRKLLLVVVLGVGCAGQRGASAFTRGQECLRGRIKDTDVTIPASVNWTPTRDDLKCAVKYFGEAVRLDPATAEYRVELGVVLGRLGLHSQAATEFQEALKLDPANERARRNLAIAQDKVESDRAGRLAQEITTRD